VTPSHSSRRLRIGPSCYHVLHLVPPTIADELNYFYDEGLRDEEGVETYEIVRESHAPFMFEKQTLWQTMKERGIDVTMDVKPSTVAFLQQQGKGLRVIAGWRNQMPFYVVGRRGLSTLKDLTGRRVGIIDPDDILVTMLTYWLIQEGIDPENDIEWVTGIDTRRGPYALREGRADAAFVDSLDLPGLIDEGYEQIFDVGVHYPNGRPDRVIAATEKAIDERPDDLRAFIKGMIRAYWFIRRQPENIEVTAAIEARLRRHSPDPDERARMAQFGSSMQAEMMPFPIDGLPTGLEQYLKEAVVIGAIDDYVEPNKISQLDLATGAYGELQARSELKGDLERAKQVVAKYGY
jgi:ABC-type nitrate/sulfonate/bicarbonate transport system substrate-binding protein